MPTAIPPEQANDPTFKKYFLNCKVKFFKKTITEDIGHGRITNYERNMVLLIPQESDECHRFYHAWVPSVVTQHYELAGIIGSPINSPARFSVHMGHDERCDRPYLYLMSKGVEDIIAGMITEGRVLRVTTLPANEEDEADNAQDASDGNFLVE